MVFRSIIRPGFRSFSSTRPALSGHNKWSKIKEKKGINDAKKSVAYTKASREIMTAVRLGGSADPDTNSALGAILRRLKDIPKENIQNALDKAIKKGDQRGEDIVYQALAHGKVGLMIECTTDNPSRTIGNLRHILSAHNARIASVGFMFRRIGSVTVIARKEPDELALIELIDIATENGAEGVTEHFWSDMEVELRFTCPPEQLRQLTTALSAPGVCQTLLTSEIMFTPIDADTPIDTDNIVDDEDPDMAAKISDLVGEIEDNEDTKRVWISWSR
ncbi:DUF28-domain-containing protein [Mycena sanguinolenta]|nr:DUF28-domain-containing protein [Mycena sanguinolenta]